MDRRTATPGLSRARALLVVALCTVAIIGVWFRRNDLAFGVVIVSLVVASAIERRMSQRSAHRQNA